MTHAFQPGLFVLALVLAQGTGTVAASVALSPVSNLPTGLAEPQELDWCLILTCVGPCWPLCDGLPVGINSA